MELTVEAALTGSRALFVEALLADGCVSDPAVAGRLADDLLAAHKPHLPQFAVSARLFFDVERGLVLHFFVQ